MWIGRLSWLDALSLGQLADRRPEVDAQRDEDGDGENRDGARQPDPT